MSPCKSLDSYIQDDILKNKKKDSLGNNESFFYISDKLSFRAKIDIRCLSSSTTSTNK